MFFFLPFVDLDILLLDSAKLTLSTEHSELPETNYFRLRLSPSLFQAEMKSFQEEISSEVKAVLERTQYEIRDVQYILLSR